MQHFLSRALVQTSTSAFWGGWRSTDTWLNSTEQPWGLSDGMEQFPPLLLSLFLFLLLNVHKITKDHWATASGVVAVIRKFLPVFTNMECDERGPNESVHTDLGFDERFSFFAWMWFHSAFICSFKTCQTLSTLITALDVHVLKP